MVLLWLVACEPAPRGVVASVGTWTLTEDRLAELMVLAQPFPLDSASAQDLVRHWMGAAAVALHSREPGALLAPEAVGASTWLDRREGLLSEDRERRFGQTASLSAEAAKEIFDEGSVRLIAHVLRRVGPETSSSERILQQRTAERILAGLVEGGPWEEGVAESEDPASRDASGLLGLVAAGELPSTLDRAAFRLEAGQISGVVQSGEGFHILYRPRYEDVDGLFTSRLRQRRLSEAEEAANLQLASESGVQVLPEGTQMLATIADGPLSWLDSERPLAEWDGGILTAGTASRYVVALPIESRAALSAADASDRAALIHRIAIRELRLGRLGADGPSKGMALDSALTQAHAADVAYWMETLELDPSSSPSRSALGRHMERVVSRREEVRALRPLFEAWLFRQERTRSDDQAVLRALVKAERMLKEASAEDAARR